jgi:hypothetical protein
MRPSNQLAIVSMAGEIYDIRFSNQENSIRGRLKVDSGQWTVDGG